MDTSIVSTFWLSDCLNNVAMNISVQVFVWTYVGIYQGVEWLGLMIILFLTFCKTVKLFSKVAVSSFYNPTTYECSSFSVSLPTLVIVCLFEYEVGSHGSLICTSLVTSDVEHLSMWIVNIIHLVEYLLCTYHVTEFFLLDFSNRWSRLTDGVERKSLEQAWQRGLLSGAYFAGFSRGLGRGCVIPDLSRGKCLRMELATSTYCTYLLSVVLGSLPTCFTSFRYVVEGVKEADSHRHSGAQVAAVRKWALQ